jgi:HK97 family phage portal protein
VNILGFNIQREEKSAQFETVLQRIIAAAEGRSASVTPENCEQSPTVKAIVSAISNRLSVTPVHVYRKATKNGRETKEQLPNHPVAKLLAYPNEYQTRVSFWADAASTLVRYGNFCAYKGRGSTGPVRFLTPLEPMAIAATKDRQTGAIVYKYGNGPDSQDYTIRQLVHVRGTARNFYWGDSPVTDVADTIGLEIAAEKFGLSFFQNGALPLMIFRYMQGSAGFKTADAERQFVEDFQTALGGTKRHRAMLLPKGIETGDPIKVENDKAQMIETRRYQRTVIAGAFGVPPQYVGDLERATFNNAEQQTIQFTADVIYPVVQKFEAALERDLLTDEDWANGVVIRFNLDSILRADFKSRQEGLQIQRQNGVLSADEWREIEGKNPIDEGSGGDEYWRPGNMLVAGEPLPEPAPPAPAAPDEPKQVFNLSMPVNVQTKVDGTTVDVQGSRTTVESPASNQTIHTHLDLPDAPTVNVDAPTVNVSQPDVKVYVPAPNVNITNDVTSPTVNVAAPDVQIDNHVESPTVNIEPPQVTFEATMPEAKVTIQPVTVRAPDVHVHNELPEYDVIETAAVRDKAGKIAKTVTTRKKR